MNLDIIRFQDVSAGYGDLVAVEHVTAEIGCSSLVAIVGPNGAGKSTLLRAILGWVPLKTGHIYLGDDHIQHQRPRLSYVPQKIRVDWDFPATVRSVVEQGRYPAIGNWKGFSEEDHRAVDSAMGEMNLTDLAERQIGKLSGGQQQRVFLARALAQGGDIFLLDEPFDGLDAIAAQNLMHMLYSWRKHHRTVLAVVHDLNMIKLNFTHIMMLNKRLIAAGPMEETMTPKNIEATYGRSVAPISHRQEHSHA